MAWKCKFCGALNSGYKVHEKGKEIEKYKCGKCNQNTLSEDSEMEE